MEQVLLSAIFDLDLLQRMIDERVVNAVHDLDSGLVLYNYTARAQYQAIWNDVTLACRGLITTADGIVVARPFPKFFNYAPELVAHLDGAVRVTDKLDGSLGILYQTGETRRIATRGSFTSDQALHATQLLENRHSRFQPRDGWTYLFEIIYPANRIVVDYEGRDELVLIGAVDNTTGLPIALEAATHGWDGPVVETLPYRSLPEALSAAPRPNAEGFVIHFLDHGALVKLKQSDYVALHQLVTGVSERRIWEVLSNGENLGAWLDVVPDELHQFVTTCRDRFLVAHAAMKAELHAEHSEIITKLAPGWTRRDLADGVRQSTHPLAKGVFALHDGKSVDQLIWAQLRPDEHIPYHQATNP
jgi:RNA ligase